MPSQPPVFRHPTARTARERKAEHDVRRRRSQPWRAWYKTALWQQRRAEQLARQPLCERHLARGEVVAATVANHKEPHRGYWQKFAHGALESACDHCHNSDIQREERALDGAADGEG